MMVLSINLMGLVSTLKVEESMELMSCKENIIRDWSTKRDNIEVTQEKTCRRNKKELIKSLLQTMKYKKKLMLLSVPPKKPGARLGSTTMTAFGMATMAPESTGVMV